MGISRISAVLALSLLLPVLGAEYLSCQVPTIYLRVLHQVDISKANSDFLALSLQGSGGAIDQFDTWLRVLYEQGVASGIDTFSNKQAITGDAADTCLTHFRSLQDSSVVSDFNTISTVGNAVGEVSTFDAINAAGMMDWEVPMPQGRRLVFLYASSLPATQSALPAYNGSLLCETEDFPSLAQANVGLTDKSITVVYIVPHAHVAAYKTAFATDWVVPQYNDPTEMYEVLKDTMDSIFCGEDLPTPMPQTTTTTTTQTTTTPIIPQVSTTPSIFPPICLNDSVLQLLHVQDMSWSYSDDFQNMKGKFPDLFTLLDNQFPASEFALTSFSDKPIPPFGYSPYDYCYREDLNFTKEGPDFIDALTELEQKSGRDWPESQLDAMLYGSLSNSLGWNFNDKTDGGAPILRVVLVATDAGPHLKGSANLPAFDRTGSCLDHDYPSGSDVGSVLDDVATYPIFVVTSDIYNYWNNIVAGFPFSSVVPSVLELSSTPEELFAQIIEALEDLCEDNTRRLSLRGGM